MPDKRALLALDQAVRVVSDGKYHALPTDKIKENQSHIYQASLGREDDPDNMAVWMDDSDLSYHLESNIHIYKISGELTFLKTVSKGGG